MRKVRRQLAGSGIVAGTTREHVEEWLTARGIRHEYTQDFWVRLGYPSSKTASDIDRLIDSASRGLVLGKTYSENVDGISNGEIWIYFVFGADDRLIRYQVHGWSYFL